MNKTLATAVLGISPEMQLLELIDQAARCGTPEDAKQIYRKDATSTGIYDRVRANLPADKMRAFNLLARNALNWAESYPNWQRCVRIACRYERKEADGGTCTPLPIP